MPERKRRNAAEPETPKRHTEPSAEMVTGTIVGRITPKVANGKKVADIKVQQPGDDGQDPVVWSGTVWNEGSARDAFKKLKPGDTITAAGEHRPDRDYNGNTYTHQLYVTDIFVEDGDRSIALRDFDRSMLRTPELLDTGTPEAPEATPDF